MDSNVKGAVAEQAIVLAATRLPVPVLRPVSEHGRYDLALEIGDRLWRVQCKWGRLTERADAISVHLSTCRCTPTGYVRTAYTADEIDAIAVYCLELDRCFLLPMSAVAEQRTLRLRLAAARNGQQACITLADDFDFEGAIAQLGERCHGMAEVVGSSPTSSTSPGAPVVIGANPFRDRFGYWMERVAAGEQIVVTHRGRPRIRLSPATAPRPPLLPQPP